MYTTGPQHPSGQPKTPLTDEEFEEGMERELAETFTLEIDNGESEGSAGLEPDARARTLDFDPTDAPKAPDDTPVVVNLDSDLANGMVQLPKVMAEETHAERVRTGLPPDPSLVPTGEEIERYAEKRDAVSEWRNKYLQSRSLITALAYPLEQFIVLLGGSVPWGTEPQDLIGPSSSALEALRVLKTNWDSMQPELAARAAAEAQQEVPLDGSSKPEGAE